MGGIDIYIIVFLLIFVINIIPAFMPPTWIILSFLYIQYHLLFIPTVVVGVIAATLGRIVLSLIAKKWLRRFIPGKYLANYTTLGQYFKKNQKLTIPFVLGYAFSPISSNSLFIIAGLSDLRLHIIAFSFFIGRLISYSFWITTSHQILHRLDEIFVTSFSSSKAFISAFFSVLIIFVIGKINWSKFLKGPKK